MLDSVHRFALKSVIDGDHDETPAVRNLLELGLVERVDGSALRVTPAGETALRLSKPTRLERIGLWGAAGGAAVVGLAWVIERLAS